MGLLDQIADDLIQNAIKEGYFENLPGKGKPFNWEIIPHEPDDLIMANLMFRNNCFVYPWMEKRTQIESKIDQASNIFSLARETSSEEDLKKQVVSEFITDIQLINGEILDYNLSIPSRVFQRSTLLLEIEIQKAVGSDTWSKISELIGMS